MRVFPIAAAALMLAACSSGPERGGSFVPTTQPATIAGACRSVELGRPAPGDEALAAYGYEQGRCGPDSYAAALWGGYPARR